MAEVKWTEDQRSAIESRGENILVSAAAGSGKTTVLVERVLRMITDSNHPVDLSSLLIMTFTRAAAAQMKEKIYRSIRKAIQAHPDDQHLKKQLHEVASARIYTIDALSMEIVRDHFHAVDIDPGFRIAEESETEILKTEVLADIIEEHYADPTSEFLKFVNFYIDKSDARIEKIILNLYKYAQSHPEPEKWIRDCIAPYTMAAYLADTKDVHIDEDAVNAASRWHETFSDLIRMELQTLLSSARKGLDISLMNYGPFKYEEPFRELITFLEGISGDDCTFDLIGPSISEHLDEWKRSPSISKKDEVDPDLKEAASDIRKSIKSGLEELQKKFFSENLETAYMNMAGCADIAEVIADLTLEFSKRFHEAKKERNIADFNDVAHLALKVLLEYDENGCIKRDSSGNPVYTKAADDMAAGIHEIIVDEYQDTNLIQEYMIGALSSERSGRPDVFMVGDVKQSIYGFRMACPELFNEKYNRYGADSSAGKRILLRENFRSRKEVLDITNAVFDQMMIPEVGGIDYLDGHGLKYEADYPIPEDPSECIPEMIFADGMGEDAKLSEAYLIAEKINQLVKEGHVTCEDHADGLRNIRFSDIAILTRTSDNHEIEQTLEDMHIPVIKSSNKGFFDSLEIRLIIDLLKIVDNPYQDIPFTAVITSPVVGMTADDLARIRIAFDKEKIFSMYEACKDYAGCDDIPDDNRLKKLAGDLLDMLSEMKHSSMYMDTGSFIDYVLKRSRLDIILEAMPQGDGRRANIEFLKSKAAGESRSSYQGLFNFIRYIDQMKDSDIDFGQSQVLEGDIDAVRMMTIHKSKGLEFPVVFIARCGKSFNQKDLNDNIIMDRNLGLGLELRDPVERTVRPTLLMETIRSVKKTDMYAEEMRLLYVAMTRAKEKLIITGTQRGLANTAAAWAKRTIGWKPGRSTRLDPKEVLSCSSFMKALGVTLWSLKDIKGFRENVSFDTRLCDELEAETERVLEIEGRDRFLADAESYIHSSNGQSEAVRDYLDWTYPFLEESGKIVKLTASQLEKHAAGESSDDNPQFSKPFAYNGDETGLRGAEKGNAYHRYFELLPYEKFSSDEVIAETVIDSLNELTTSGMLSKEYASTIDPQKIVSFLVTPLGCRMRSAAQAGLLHREQQFVMRYDEDGEGRLIQGIIDAFFEEDGELVLVDYKTDRKKEDSAFVSTYTDQLNVYCKALEAALGKRVKEKIIYSVELEREIQLP